MVYYTGMIRYPDKSKAESFTTLHVYTYNITIDDYTPYCNILCIDAKDAEYEFYDRFQPGHIIPSYINGSIIP